MGVHDAVVVGAGPAGLSAAAELARAGSCLLLEQGRDHRERERDEGRDILSGVGGAGLFSDGKHSFFPSASALWALPDRPLLAEAFERSAALLRRHGVEASPWDTHAPEAPDPPPGEWRLKRYPSVYMPLAERMAAIAELARACPERWIGARVVRAARVGDELRLAVARDGALADVRTRALVVATGRLSPLWVRPWLTALGARYVFRRLEFGVRVETDSGSPLFTALPDVDPKLRSCEDPSTELRTFCTCRNGQVVLGVADDLVAFSGRADGPPTGRSNLGLLVRTRDPALARAVAPALFAARPRSLPLHAATDDALRPVFGPAGAAAMTRALARLQGLCPDLRSDRRAELHAPCIEGVGDYPDDDGHLAVAPGVWVAGDVCGRFRGIVASMVSGRYAALRLLRAR